MRDWIIALAVVGFAVGWSIEFRRAGRQIARDAFALWDLRQRRRR